MYASIPCGEVSTSRYCPLVGTAWAANTSTNYLKIITSSFGSVTWVAVAPEQFTGVISIFKLVAQRLNTNYFR
jgi:hypothetical protein